MKNAITRRSLIQSAMAGTALSGFSGRAAMALAAGASGLDLASMDRSVTPGDDFFRYASGTWLKTASIPPDAGRLTDFNRLADLNAERCHAILEEAARAPTTPELKKLGDFYASLTDEAGIEAAGLRPLLPDLERIAAIATPADLARSLAQLSADWLRPLPGGGAPMPLGPVSATIAIDSRQPTRYLPTLEQGGIGLPDRDYFFGDDPDFAKARTAYRAHLVAMFRLARLSNPEARAERVYALDERIAKAHWTRQALRDVEKRYNLWLRADFAAKAPGLDWDAFLAAAGMADQPVFLVSSPSAIAGLAEAAAAVPMQDWRDYLTYRALHAFAPYGPKALVAQNFAFEDQALAGSPAMAPAWKRAVATIDRGMGHATGRVYLEEFFPPAARAEAKAMTANIIAAMGRRIQALSWMTQATKARALAKLAVVRVEVGGQEPLRTYEALRIDRGDAYGNVQRAARADYRHDLERLKGPVDRGAWTMLPQTVNAQSNTTLVKIMFPAGIMQGLFFNPAADPAVNYGAIGVVMGHELSHQFDDQGAKYDEHGMLDNWWTPEDLKQFTAVTGALAAQYDGYEPLPGAHINGRLTLGENLADLAGLSIARDAYYASLGGKTAPVLDGFSADQRFYLAYAQVYRSLLREAFLRQALVVDPHSQGEWRAAEVRNVDPWYAAFAVKPGQMMYLPPEQRVRIW